MGTIVGLFRREADADLAIRQLETAGFGHNQVGIIAPNTIVGKVDRQEDKEQGTVQADSKFGAAGGAAIGGLTGLLLGLSAITLPGLGPVLVAGVIASATGMGAVAGGILGGLMNMGISEEKAGLYAEGVKRGGILVVVQADETREAEVRKIMQNAGALEIDEQRQEWETSGWTGFDEGAAPDETYPQFGRKS